MTAPTQPSKPDDTNLSAAFWQNMVFKYLEEGFVPNADCSVADLKEKINKMLGQTREEVFEQLRKSAEKDDKREHFLDYCLGGAIESGHAGSWMTVVEYDSGFMPDRWSSVPNVKTEQYRPASAAIIDSADDHVTQEYVDKALGGPNHYDVTHETIELGLRRIRGAHNVPDTGTGNWERGLTSVPGLGQHLRDEIIQADLANDAGRLDVIGYLAILEVAIFGEVRYC